MRKNYEYTGRLFTAVGSIYFLLLTDINKWKWITLYKYFLEIVIERVLIILSYLDDRAIKIIEITAWMNISGKWNVLVLVNGTLVNEKLCQCYDMLWSRVICFCFYAYKRKTEVTV